MFKGKYYFLIIFLLFAFGANGQNKYIVRHGDTLSEILWRSYPQYRLYGPSGTLQKTIRLNKILKSPHLIFPEQIILLPNLKATEVDAKVVPREYEKSIKARYEGAVFIGNQYYDFRQEQLSGNTEFKENFPFLNIRLIRYLGDWGDRVALTLINYKAPERVVKDKSLLFNFIYAKSWRRFYMGAVLEPTRLFYKDLSNNFKLMNESVYSIRLGHSRYWNIFRDVPLRLHSDVSLALPVAGRSHASEITARNYGGLSFAAQAEFKYKVSGGTDRDTYFSMPFGIQYTKLERNISYQGQTEKVKSSTTSLVASIGLIKEF